MNEVMQEAASLARVPSPDVETLTKEKQELLHHHKMLLPIESALKAHIEKRVGEIDHDVQSYLGAHEHRHGQQPLPMLALDVLRWRHPRGVRGIPLPKLALVNVNNGMMRIGRDGVSGAAVPAVVACYRDVMNACLNRTNSNRSNVYVECRYNGAIPTKIRDLIHEEKRNFDAIYLLVDAPREAWVYHEETKTRAQRLAERVADPLVVGWRSVGLYLLGQFDPTPIEAYAAAEFTHRPTLKSGRPELTR